MLPPWRPSALSRLQSGHVRETKRNLGAPTRSGIEGQSAAPRLRRRCYRVHTCVATSEKTITRRNLKSIARDIGCKTTPILPLILIFLFFCSCRHIHPYTLPQPYQPNSLIQSLFIPQFTLYPTPTSEQGCTVSRGL